MCSGCLRYLCGCSIEGDAQDRAEAQSSCHRQCHQQDPCQPYGPLRLGTVPPQHGQTCIGQLRQISRQGIKSTHHYIHHVSQSWNIIWCIGQKWWIHISSHLLLVCSHHQQVSTGHTDDTDVRERLEDIFQSGGGERQDLLRRVCRNALQHRLETGSNAKRWLTLGKGGIYTKCDTVIIW